MKRELILTPEAQDQLRQLEADPSQEKRWRVVQKVLGLLETNLRHPSLETHEFVSQSKPGQKVFEAYAQNQTPGAYRVFWRYGPDRQEQGQNIPVLTIISIVPHPK